MNQDSNRPSPTQPSTKSSPLTWLLMIPVIFLLVAGSTFLFLNVTPIQEMNLGEPSQVTILSSLQLQQGEHSELLVRITEPTGNPIAQIPVALQLDVNERIEATTDQRGNVVFPLPIDLTVGEHNVIVTVPRWQGYRASGLRSALTVGSFNGESVNAETADQAEQENTHDHVEPQTSKQEQTDHENSGVGTSITDDGTNEDGSPKVAVAEEGGHEAHSEADHAESDAQESSIIIRNIVPTSPNKDTPVAIATHDHWFMPPEDASGENIDVNNPNLLDHVYSLFMWRGEDKPEGVIDHEHEIIVQDPAAVDIAVTDTHAELSLHAGANTQPGNDHNASEGDGVNHSAEITPSTDSHSASTLTGNPHDGAGAGSIAGAASTLDAHANHNVDSTLQLPSLAQNNPIDGSSQSRGRWIDTLFGIVIGMVLISTIYLFLQSGWYLSIRNQFRNRIETTNQYRSQFGHMRSYWNDTDAGRKSDDVGERNKEQNERLLRILFNYLGQVRWSLATAGGAMLAFTLMELLAPWPLKIIIDYVLLEEPLPMDWVWLNQLLFTNKTAVLFGTAGLMLVIALLTSLFSYIQVNLTAQIGYRLVYTLRTELFDHLQRLSLAFHNNSRRGELLTKVSSDTNTLKDLIADSGLDLVLLIMKSIGMFIVMFWLNWRLASIVLITFPVLYVVFNYLRKHLKESVRQQRKNEGRIASQLTDMLTAIPLVQAFGREEHQLDQFRHESERSMDEGVRVARLDATVSQAIAIINTVGISTVMVFGAWQALNGNLTAGALLVFVTYTRSLYKPISKLVKLFAKLTKASVSISRVGEILAVEPAMQDAPDAVVAHKLRGEINFSRVSFGYENALDTLTNVSFEIKAGQRVALVGSSGAGKSTIVSLLLRLYDPSMGAITIDGVNLRDYQRRSLRNEIGLVLQDSILFGTSIADNIRYGHPDASMREIEAAARQAHIHDFVWSLPDRYDTVVGEMGSTLSGGQRQRIAIARALVKRPSILVLDEPTSALDAESRSLIQQTLDKMQWGKTIILIAHDLSSVRNFDQILVMENGQVIENGTHQELMASQGTYWQLAQLEEARKSATEGEGEAEEAPKVISLPKRKVLQQVTT